MTNEMVLLRNRLTANGISWSDHSDAVVDRTHFHLNRTLFSAAHGYNTMGEHMGKLELWDFHGDPVGYLTSDDIAKLLNLV